MLVSHQFHAFDTDISIAAVSENINIKNIFQKIETNAEIFEKKFSRFDSKSELNKINYKKTKQIKVSKEMLDLLSKAKQAFRKTKGLFDPTILTSLENIGYNKTFSKIDQKNISLPEIKTKFKTRIPFSRLRINKKNQIIASPPSLLIDLGGIAKGYWVDKIVPLLNKYSDSFWISAGGDIFIKGKKENGNLWEVGVQNPLNLDNDILTLNVPSHGIGIATSGITKRHGKNGKIFWHHIIDPHSGIPVKNDILSVTVLTNSTTNADIIAKTILILGIQQGLAKINTMRNYECIIIDKKSKIHVSKGIKKFL